MENSTNAKNEETQDTEPLMEPTIEEGIIDKRRGRRPKRPLISINKENLSHCIESLLFACGRYITIDELYYLLGGVKKPLIEKEIRKLKESLHTSSSCLKVVEENGRWKLTVADAFIPLVKSINPHTELSKTILETLAVVAWKAPALQSEVIKIRTNKAYEHLDSLEDMGFITREKKGRSKLIKLSSKFFDYFDLEGADSLQEFTKRFRKQIEVKDEQTKIQPFIAPQGQFSPYPPTDLSPSDDKVDEVDENSAV